MERIQYTICPECGAPFTSIEQETDTWSLEKPHPQVRRHLMNDDGWETIRFACGRVDKYIPNYRNIETTLPCKNDPVIFEQIKKKEMHREHLLKVVNEIQDLDPHMRENLIRNIKYS